MLKLSKFGRGNYKCFKNGNYKSWKRTAGTPYHWMRSFKSRDRPDMQHKLSSSICPILLNFQLSLCSVIIWGKLQLAVSPTSQRVNILVVDSSWILMAHVDARSGKWRGNWRMECVASTFTLPRNMVYPALLPPMHTPRLPVVDWTDPLADLNGLVCFAERRNLFSARVPSHFNWPLTQSVSLLATDWTPRESNPVGGEFSAPVQTGLGAHPGSY